MICETCGWEINPNVCHCGIDREHHNYYDEGHNFVPMGCTCGYADAEKRKNLNYIRSDFKMPPVLDRIIYDAVDAISHMTTRYKIIDRLAKLPDGYYSGFGTGGGHRGWPGVKGKDAVPVVDQGLPGDPSEYGDS